MANYSLSFIAYNPFTDERLNPTSGQHLNKYPEVPIGLDATVQKAKKRIQTDSIEVLNKRLPTISKMVDSGLMSLISYEFRPEDGFDYIHTNDATQLMAHLQHNATDSDQKEWPAQMATLSLAIAGQIYNELWPNDDYSRLVALETGGLVKAGNIDPAVLLQLSLDAAAAAANAELLHKENQFISDATIQKKNAQNAPKAHQAKHKLADAYIEWATNLPADHPYGTKAAAVTDFINTELSDQQRRHIAANTNRFLNEKLNAYVKEHRIPHPISR